MCSLSHVKVAVKVRLLRSHRARSRCLVALHALILLAAVAITVPAGALAEGASQPTSAAAARLDAGLYHTCAVLASADVRCWGFSGDGQLGYGDTNTIGDNETPGSAGPVNLGPGRTATAISAGTYHTCAVLDHGSVRCWGYGFDGQLGYGDRNDIGDNEAPGSVGPVDLGAGRTATAISAGGRHTCAVLDHGSVRCWGLGDVGQLGYGDTATIGDNETPGSVGPVNFGAGRTATAITAGGRHTCAVLDNGSVRCWGYGGNGQLGYGDTNAVQDPGLVGAVDLGSGRTAVAISAGDAHTCAILDNGSVRCWGFAGDGELGYGNTNPIGDNETPGSVAPVDLGSGRTAVAISAGGAHTCAMLDNGGVRCWGSAGNGRLGYCNTNNIGDDEAPGSVGPLDLVAPGPPCTPPTGGGTGGTQTSTGTSVPPPTAAAPSRVASTDPLATEALRARDLRSCLAGETRMARRKRASARRACLKRYGRTPGRVFGLQARAASKTKIVLSFTAPGTDGAHPPAARTYLVKQSRSPIRDARGFVRAHTLCKGSCRFQLPRVGADVSLTVVDLRPRRTYYYAVAARDNVSSRLGPRSKTVKAKTP